jgi:phosphate transport system substrate-binding protein
VAIIVNKGNPVPPLTASQFHGLFTRTYTNWREVSGKDEAVVVIQQAEADPLRQLLLEHFGILSRQVPPGPSVLSTLQAVEAVAAQPRALSYTSLGAASNAAHQGQAIRLLPLDGIAATPENVQNGTYPLSRPLNLLTRGVPRELVREFIDFARSDQVHDLIVKCGFTPVTP